MSSVASFPYWELIFKEDGQFSNSGAIERFIAEVREQNVTDLFVFSHGWNNNYSDAVSLYERFFDQVKSVSDRFGFASGVKIGVAGVIWPSILFPDDAPPKNAVGLASIEGGAESDDVFDALRIAFPDKTEILDELGQLLNEHPSDLDSLNRFHDLLKQLAPATSSEEDSAESAIIENSAEKVFDAMASIAPATERQGTAGFGDFFGRLWTGAKEALRVTSYWSMKERAGVVGERGLGPLIGRLSNTRVHLIGHSFGARLVSFSLKGLPGNLAGPTSPVKSLTLLQGAFSHFAFADSLPQDTRRGGALQGMASRVDGPIVVTHSKYDLAVCERYPQASIISGDDTAAFEDIKYRFGAMGADGAQAVSAESVLFKPEGSRYSFEKGRFLNFDGNDLITRGGPPSGAHSDVFYPEIAWMVMLAAGVTNPG
jgi:hypothetical protein